MSPDLENEDIKQYARKYLFNREFTNLKIGDYVTTKEYNINQDIIVLQDDILGLFDTNVQEHPIISIIENYVTKDVKRKGTKISQSNFILGS